MLISIYPHEHQCENPLYTVKLFIGVSLFIRTKSIFLWKCCILNLFIICWGNPSPMSSSISLSFKQKKEFISFLSVLYFSLCVEGSVIHYFQFLFPLDFLLLFLFFLWLFFLSTRHQSWKQEIHFSYPTIGLHIPQFISESSEFLGSLFCSDWENNRTSIFFCFFFCHFFDTGLPWHMGFSLSLLWYIPPFQHSHIECL